MASSTHCGVCAFLHVIEARQSTFLSVPSLRDMGLSRETWSVSTGTSRAPSRRPCAPPRRRSWGRSWGICKLIRIVQHLIIVYF